MTEVIKVDEIQVDVEEQRAAAEGYLQIEVNIKDQTDYASAVDTLKEIKSRIKALEDERKAITRPLDASKKRVMDLFKPVVTSYQTAEKKIKSALVTYDTEQEKKRQEEARKLAELQAKAEAEGIECDLTISEPERPQGISYREDWKFEITDVNSLPRKYMVPDEKTLSEIARSTKGLVEIPGVKFYSVKIPVSRS